MWWGMGSCSAIGGSEREPIELLVLWPLLYLAIILTSDYESKSLNFKNDKDAGSLIYKSQVLDF